VDRATPNRSASSEVVYSPERNSAMRCASWRGLSFGCLPRSLPLALAIFIPSRVRSRIRSASNSATITSTLNNSRPTGSSGSCSEPAISRRTCRRVSSSTMSRASGRPARQVVAQRFDEFLRVGEHELAAEVLMALGGLHPVKDAQIGSQLPEALIRDLDSEVIADYQRRAPRGR
jgi:hypothetical protein